jgi:hypothetical protein
LPFIILPYQCSSVFIGVPNFFHLKAAAGAPVEAGTSARSALYFAFYHLALSVFIGVPNFFHLKAAAGAPVEAGTSARSALLFALYHLVLSVFPISST